MEPRLNTCSGCYGPVAWSPPAFDCRRSQRCPSQTSDCLPSAADARTREQSVTTRLYTARRLFCRGTTAFVCPSVCELDSSKSCRL